MVLKSGNDIEFSYQNVPKDIWPELKIIYGESRHSQSQGSV